MGDIPKLGEEEDRQDTQEVDKRQVGDSQDAEDNQVADSRVEDIRDIREVAGRPRNLLQVGSLVEDSRQLVDTQGSLEPLMVPGR